MKRGALLAVTAIAFVIAAATVRADAPPPWTALDPPALVTPPTTAPVTGAPVGVARGGRIDEARRIVLRVLEAIRMRDTTALETLTADPLPHLEGGAPQPRRDAIVLWLRAADSRGFGRGAEIADYVDLAHAQVSPAALRPGSHLRHGDLVVTAQLRARSPQAVAPLPFEHGLILRFVVRLAPDGRVVGL